MIRYFHEELDPECHIIVAQHRKRTVGELKWFTDNHQISNIEVHPKYRRQGIATEMLQQARLIDPEVNADHAELTDDGAKWWPIVKERLEQAAGIEA